MMNEIFRAALLGGMPTSVQTSAVFELPSASEEQSEGLSLPKLEKLQQITLEQSTKTSASELWLQHRNDYGTLIQGSYARRTRIAPDISEDFLVRVSQGAQWHSQRTDIISRLRRVYSFRDERNVMSFLERNIFLAPLLLQASIKIRDYFDASSLAALDVSSDPDNNEYQELWVRIQTSLSPSDALSLLTRFDEEWWFQASSNSSNLLNVKLEYV